MPRIFISYRRDDTSSVVGRLYDHLAGELGEDCVFRDIYSIDPGAEFEKAIDETLKSFEVCLVVIGRRWLAGAPGLDGPRIADPHDFVRREIEGAMTAGLRVIPVLVEGGTLPAADTLPETLRPLVKRHAIELLDSRWKDDVARLIDFLTYSRDDVPASRRANAGAWWWPRIGRAPAARALIAGNLAAAILLILDLTLPLTTWQALFGWTLDHLAAITGIAGALVAVAMFVTRGVRERTSRGIKQVLWRLQTWAEGGSRRSLLMCSFAALSVSIWVVPEGVTIRQRSGPVPEDFCSRFFVDSQMQPHRVQQCPGDRNQGQCGAVAFSCAHYEIAIFTGVIARSAVEASVAISGQSLTWADGALEKAANHGWVFSWSVDGRELSISTPRGSTPRMFRILATHQHDPDTMPASADIRVTVSTGAGSTFTRSRTFKVLE